ncbi:MAG: hypothetical protein IJZ46_00075 [Bacilli bacterium]|nr:hypothetical protein [Bacilli bacterium]
MKIKNLGKKNIILLIIIAVLLLVVGGSLAFFGWNSTAENKDRIVDVTINSGSGECSKLTDNTKLLVPTSSRENGRIITMKAKQTMADNAVITWTLTVNKLNTDDTTTNGLKNESFKYELINNTTGVSYGNGNFANITEENNTITFSTTKETLDYNVDYEFILYLWIDGVTFGNNPLDMASQEYNFDMNCNITGVAPPVSGATMITNLYNPTKTADNNRITYNLDDTNKLMEDVGGNLRYYGATPNNYIYFNCTTYPETGCETWRIIGIFDGKIKVMRSSSIASIAWDQDKNQTGVSGYNNDWSNSSLRDLLNNEYYYGDTSGEVTYYSFPDGSSSTKINMTSMGIKNNTTRRLIADSTYYLRGTNASLYPNEMYSYERETGSVFNESYLASIPDKIALPYASDYGYAADLSQCKEKTLISYNDSSCTENNWMKLILAANEVNADNSNWLLTHRSDYFNYAWGVHSSGDLFSAVNVYGMNGVTPVLYLNTYVVIDSTNGDGSEGSPYRILPNK